MLFALENNILKSLPSIWFKMANVSSINNIQPLLLRYKLINELQYLYKDNIGFLSPILLHTTFGNITFAQK